MKYILLPFLRRYLKKVGAYEILKQLYKQYVIPLLCILFDHQWKVKSRFSGLEWSYLFSVKEKETAQVCIRCGKQETIKGKD